MRRERVGSCSRVKGCHSDSAAETGMVRLVQKSERIEKGKEWKKEERLGRGGWKQDPIKYDGGQKTEEWMCWCDVLSSSPF